MQGALLSLKAPTSLLAVISGCQVGLKWDSGCRFECQKRKMSCEKEQEENN
jgi:hypothetical protein